MIYVTSHPKLETESEIFIIILLTISPITTIQKKRKREQNQYCIELWTMNTDELRYVRKNVSNYTGKRTY